MITEQTHYFTDNHNLPTNRKDHSFRFSSNVYTFTTDDGVFSKTGVDYGTQVLLNAVIEEPLQGEVLDLGCGYGVIATVVARHFPQCCITAADVNSRAVELTMLNTQRNGAEVHAIVSDGFSGIDGMFDAVLTNPPIRTGKKVIYGMFEDAYKQLNDGGVLMAVIRRQQGAESAVRKFREIFGNCEVVSRDKGYWVLKAIKQAKLDELTDCI